MTPPPNPTSGPTSPIEQLVYRSLSASGAASGLEMSDILAVARPANENAGVTGALTVVDGQFVQVIEGAGDALDTLLVRLRRDPRHTRLEVLERRVVAARAFGDWDMISPRLAPTEVDAIAGLTGDPSASIDDYIVVLKTAITRQEAVIRTGERGHDARHDMVPVECDEITLSPSGLTL